jgi:hypothetical protein
MMFGVMQSIPLAGWNHLVRQEKYRSQKNFTNTLKTIMNVNTGVKQKLKAKE